MNQDLSVYNQPKLMSLWLNSSKNIKTIFQSNIV
jgi:hypothetical protein